jgi:hypothetical protein
MDEIKNDHILTLYDVGYSKIRLGEDCDGGYVICDLPISYLKN